MRYLVVILAFVLTSCAHSVHYQYPDTVNMKNIYGKYTIHEVTASYVIDGATFNDKWPVNGELELKSNRRYILNLDLKKMATLTQTDPAVIEALAGPESGAYVVYNHELTLYSSKRVAKFQIQPEREKDVLVLVETYDEDPMLKELDVHVTWRLKKN